MKNTISHKRLLLYLKKILKYSKYKHHMADSELQELEKKLEELFGLANNGAVFLNNDPVQQSQEEKEGEEK